MKNNKSQNNIPDGWQYAKLGDFLEKMEGGGTPSKENEGFWCGTIPWASVKDVVTHNPHDTQDHISEDGLKNSSSRLVPKGTLVVPTRMALGHAVVFNIDVAINQDLKALYPKKQLSNKFLFYWFESKKEFIKRLGSGSTVDGIQQNELKAIKFSLPPASEQKRIVSVLETLESVIEKLAKKIKARKNIKKGLMQNLLTGKVRLAGFKKKWEQCKVSDICEIKKGQDLSKEKLSSDGKYKCILYGELYTKYSELIGNVLSRTNFKEGVISVSGDILIPASTTTSAMDLAIAACLNEGDILLGGDINILRAKKKYDSRFLALYLTHVKKHNLARLAQGITIVHLYGKDFKKLSVEIPEIKEQSAIADIFVAIDKEIEALNKKLMILKEQKKYLLNNLITGTIRTKA
jgi:type I restriction enzyme S subunit